MRSNLSRPIALIAACSCLVGMLAGFYGGWVDAILSRVMDIFFALPFLLGGIVFLVVVKSRDVITIASILIILAWTTVARVMRGSVLASKNLDYVQAAKALGASNARLMFRHIMPNAVAPVVVLATISLGGFVTARLAPRKPMARSCFVVSALAAEGASLTPSR